MYNGTLIRDLETAVDRAEKRALVSVNFGLAPEVYDQVKALAAEANVPVAEVLRTAVRDLLKGLEQDAKN